MEALVDPERVALARSGDAAAFEALVEARVGSMVRTAMAILGREDEARDAVQDTLVTAWRELASLRDPAAFDAWLTRILVNRCRRGLRTFGLTRMREIPADEVAEIDVPRTADVAGAVVDRGRSRTCLRPAVDRRADDPRPPPPRRTAAGVDRGGAEDPRGHREVAAVQGAAIARAGDGARGGTMTAPLPDDQVRAMLEERAARVSPDAEREAMTAFRAAVRGAPDGTGGFAVIPQALSSRNARLPWGLAAFGMVAVVAIALLGGRLSSTNDRARRPRPPSRASPTASRHRAPHWCRPLRRVAGARRPGRPDCRQAARRPRRRVADGSGHRDRWRDADDAGPVPEAGCVHGAQPDQARRRADHGGAPRSRRWLRRTFPTGPTSSSATAWG